MTSHFQARRLVLGIFLLLTTCSSHDLNPLELGLFKAMVVKCLDDETYFIAGFCQDVFQRAEELGLLSEGKVTSGDPLPIHSEGEKNTTGVPSPTNHTKKTYSMIDEKDTSEVRRSEKHVKTDVGEAETSHFDERTHQAPLTGHQVNNMNLGKAPLQEDDPELKKVTERSLDDSRYTETITVKFTTTNKGKRNIKQVTEDATSHEESLASRDFKKAHLKLAYDLVELLREALQRKSEIEFSRARENIGYALSAALDIELPHIVQQEAELLIGFMMKLLDNEVEMQGDDDEKVATDVAEYLSKRMSEISRYSSEGDDASLFDITTTRATPISPHDSEKETNQVDMMNDESSEEGTWVGHEEMNEWRPRRDIERWVPRSRYDGDDSRLSGEGYKATYLSSEAAAEEKDGDEEQEIEECFARYIIAEERFKSEDLKSEEKSNDLKSGEKSENLKREAKSQNFKSEEKDESLKSEDKGENLKSGEKSNVEKSENLNNEEKSENLKNEDKSENLKSEVKNEDKNENFKSEAKSENLKSEEKNENLKSEAKSENLKSEEKSAGRRLTQRAVLSYVDEDKDLKGKEDVWYIILYLIVSSFCVALAIQAAFAKMAKY